MVELFRPSRPGALCSEARLAAFRPIVPIVWSKRLKRSRKGWIIFLALIALNELRGAYVAMHLWTAFFG